MEELITDRADQPDLPAHRGGGGGSGWSAVGDPGGIQVQPPSLSLSFCADCRGGKGIGFRLG